jgi:hypothetical protein
VAQYGITGYPVKGLDCHDPESSYHQTTPPSIEFSISHEDYSTQFPEIQSQILKDIEFDFTVYGVILSATK